MNSLSPKISLLLDTVVKAEMIRVAVLANFSLVYRISSDALHRRVFREIRSDHENSESLCHKSGVK